MTSRLDLLRHGETERGGGFRGSLDDALTETGRAQMEQAVRTGGAWNLVVSSPLQRCARFAEALAERLGLPLELHGGLRELHFGEWEGRSAAELMIEDSDALGRFWDNPYDFTPPGGEPLVEFEARVLAAVRELAQPAGRHMLIVTHAGVMRLLIAHAQHRPRQLLQVEVAHAQLVTVLADAQGTLKEA